jgi:hypothetical protein
MRFSIIEAKVEIVTRASAVVAGLLASGRARRHG